MTTKLVPFVFDGRQVRTVVINGEGWFVAVDVTAVLKFGNSRQAIATHVDADDRDAVQILDVTGRSQRQTVINVYAVFSLILGSSLPDAKRFKRWVTHEVLPAIIETGKYVPGDKVSVDMPNLLSAPKPRQPIFPAEFFAELFRLCGKSPVPPHKARWISQKIIDLIWRRVDDGVFDAITKINPTLPAKSSGKLYRRYALAQFVADGPLMARLTAMIERCCEAMSSFRTWPAFFEHWSAKYPIRRDLPHELKV